MKSRLFKINTFLVAILAILLLGSFVQQRGQKSAMPYKQASLTTEQAAAHLLSRFTFGATPGQVQEVAKIGLDKWFEQQLKAGFKDADLNERLKNYDAINLSNSEVENMFPRNAFVLRQAIKDGYLNKDSVNANDKKKYRAALLQYMNDKGYKPEQELFRQLIGQKILRATYTQNQLQEVMTDFWFNHFNVAINKPQCATFIPAYERDVIRPNVFGHFDQLLVATAQSPAMLLYLDNATSAGINAPANNAMEMSNMPMARRLQAMKQKGKNKKNGLNENYAREVMELHTMGVDGGYSQSDVTQAARVLTGWTIAPMGKSGYGEGVRKTLENIGEANLAKRGFVIEGDFLFAMNRHDNGEKKVLGKTFPAGGGYQEGLDLLELLAHHQATAKFISKKIAVRFVSDNPPQQLIDAMANTFLTSDGDIKKVLITMVNSPAFWSKDALREKTKSPFELAISAVRALNAAIVMPIQLNNWITKMGQQIYYYQAPTGFPDRGQYWINTGALLSRMNFGLALTGQKIPGVKVDLLAINNNHEPESAEAALKTYSQIMMPERDLGQTFERLKPLITSPNLGKKVAKAAQNVKPANSVENDVADDVDLPKAKDESKNIQRQNAAMLAQVTGVIVGSPEFQRR